MRLLKDRELREQLGKSAREKIQNSYTLEKELEGNLAVYQQLK
jgi:hypothetical protein